MNMTSPEFDLHFFKPYPTVKKLAIDVGYVLIAPVCCSILGTISLIVAALGVASVFLCPLILAASLPIGVGVGLFTSWMLPYSDYVETLKFQYDAVSGRALPVPSKLQYYGGNIKQSLGQSILLALTASLVPFIITLTTCLTTLICLVGIIASP